MEPKEDILIELNSVVNYLMVRPRGPNGTLG